MGNEKGRCGRFEGKRCYGSEKKLGNKSRAVEASGSNGK